MKFLMTCAVLVGLTAACAPVETTPKAEPGQPIGLSASDVRTVQSGVRNAMKDPDSARFGTMAAARDSKGTVTVCGYVNGKNSFGGYTGEKPFIGIFANGSKGKTFVTAEIGGSESNVYAVRAVCKQNGVAI